MSVEIPHSVSVASDEVEIPEDPEEVFPKVLANASLCCQQCYRRLRSQHWLPKDVGQDHGDLMSFVTMDLPPGARWELLEAEWYETVQLRDRLEEMHPPGPRRRRLRDVPPGDRPRSPCRSPTPMTPAGSRDRSQRPDAEGRTR